MKNQEKNDLLKMIIQMVNRGQTVKQVLANCKGFASKTTIRRYYKIAVQEKAPAIN